MAGNYLSGDASSNGPQDMSGADVYSIALEYGATPEQAQLIAQRYSQSPGYFQGGDSQTWDNSGAARQGDAFGYGINAFPDSEFARLARSRSSTFKDSFEDIAGFAAKSAALYAGASALGGAVAGAGAGGAAADTGYAAAGDSMSGLGAGYAGEGATAAGAGASAAPTMTAGSGTTTGAGKVAGDMTWGDWAKVGSTVGSALLQGNAANKATDTANAASAADRALQLQMYTQTRADNMPALESRNAALGKMRELLGIAGSGSTATPTSSLMADPGYQFRLKTGMDQRTAALNARGMRNSPAAVKELDRYGQDYASNEYGNAVNRLSTAAGLGQAGASTIANAGQNYATNTGNNLLSTGNFNAAGQIAQGNIYGNAANQLAGWYANKTGG